MWKLAVLGFDLWSQERVCYPLHHSARACNLHGCLTVTVFTVATLSGRPGVELMGRFDSRQISHDAVNTGASSSSRSSRSSIGTTSRSIYRLHGGNHRTHKTQVDATNGARPSSDYIAIPHTISLFVSIHLQYSMLLDRGDLCMLEGGV